MYSESRMKLHEAFHQQGVFGEDDLNEILSEVKAMAGRTDTSRVLLASLPGLVLEPYDNGHGSEALLFRTRGVASFFIKYQPRITRSEFAGFNLLSRSAEFAAHLVGPSNETVDDAFWVSPFIESLTLHELALTTKPSLGLEDFTRDVFTDFLRTDSLLWHQTQRSTQADLHDLYWHRLYSPDRMSVLREIVKQQVGSGEFLDLDLVVNGHLYGKTQDIIDSVFQRLNMITHPRGCVIHGDDQPRNIIVPLESIEKNPQGWFAVDYVTAHEDADWMIAAAKLFHWWDFYCIVDMALDDPAGMENINPEMHVNAAKHRLEISYDNAALEQSLPTVVREMRNQMVSFVAYNSKSLEVSPDAWEERFRLALFAVVFGSAHRHTNELATALPLMIGKGLEYLDVQNGSMSHGAAVL